MYARESDRRSTDLIKIDQVVIEEKNQSGVSVRKYTKGKLLGKGGFAKCYEIFPHDNNKKYAVKLIQKSSLTRSKAKEKLQSEINIHKKLNSEHVVDFHHFFEDSSNVYIILQLCSNQTLSQLVKRRKRITQLEAKFYLHQIIMGIKDIHQQKVIHRDLKLGNLFLTQKLQIKIGDFGLAAKLNSETEKRKTMCGTPNYIAPEILENTPHSYEVDIWSLGVIAYALLIGRPPFETNDVKLTYSKIKSCNYSFPDTIPLEAKTKKFISKMLIRDPCRRSTVDEILQDQFFISSSIPSSLPLTVLGQPPNQNFLKKFQQLKSSNQYQSSKEGFSKRETLSTERLDRKERQKEKGQSVGRMLIRANSIDRVDKKNHVVQRACSSAALMIPKKNIQTQNQGSFETRALSANIQPLGPQVWVTYSEENPKFGICYILNSNATGMKFNDSTYLVSNSNFTKLKYFPNTKQPSRGELYDVINTPQSLSKKMKIISYYQKELKSRKESEENKMSNQERIQRQKARHRQTQETAMNIYVIKYYKTSKVHIFWFNNEDYQVIFKDHSQLQISKEHINYVNKYGQRKYFHKTSLHDQPEDIKKRMGHTETLFRKIKESKFDKNSQNNSNKENQPAVLVRSSSVTKVEKPKYTLMKGCASVSKLASYKLIK